MLHVIHILEVMLPLLYLGVFGLYLRHFLQSKDHGTPFRGTHFLYAALVLHVSYLTLRGITFHHFPVSSRAEFLSLVALCVGLVYAFAETRHKESDTGAFFIAIVAILQVMASLMVEDSTTHLILHENPVYGVHVIFTMFGFAALAVSALYALMYVLLSRQLKSRELGVIFRRLPPLSALENMSRLAATSGIALLGLGLALGHFVGLYIMDDFNFTDPKILITDIAWLAYALGLLVVKVRGLSGLRMAYFSLFGYMTFILAMVAVNTFSSTFHSFQ
ncbi:MAG: cytochrome c biogenesis protein CcsA [Bradymonadaceae bacterium]|nr:cytochrome c biogenesis protein CcsA [Lujinxingiaceae bacterium]